STAGAQTAFFFYRRRINNASYKKIPVGLLLDVAPLACSLRDINGDFLYCNDAALKMFKVTDRSTLFKHFYDFCPKLQPDGTPSRAKMKAVIQEVIAAGRMNFSWMYLSAERELIPVETSMIHVNWKGERRIASYSRDLRPVLAHEQKMREADEHHRLLEVETEAARMVSQSKSNFLAAISHEIRTPMNVIMSLSGMELQNRLPKDSLDHLKQIYNSGSILLGIIDEILDISKIESGSLALLPADYDVSAMINDVVQLNVLLMGDKNISFKLHMDKTMPAFLRGDELRVKQILNNLLSNAFKYTDEGEVVLDMGWEREHAHAWLVFTVRDTGRGIKKEDQARLFSAYSQFDVSANRHIEGTGLGLAITRNLVEMMGGSIMVMSEYRKGSTFKVRLRQELVPDDGAGAAYAAADYAPAKLDRAHMPYGKALIVDDLPINLDVAKALLTPYGLALDYASNGKEAVDKIRRQADYDIIFMDHMMPHMDGMEATRVIREEIGTEYARTVPIIAMTANALAGNRKMFLTSGFNEFISKPVDVRLLDGMLNKYVRDRQTPETLRLAERAREEKEAAGKLALSSLSFLEGRHLKGISLDEGVRRYGDEAAYMRVLRSYAAHTPRLLEKLRAVSADKLEEYAVTMRGLKSASYDICANSLGRMADDLEFAAKSDNWLTVEKDTPQILDAAEKLLRDLRSFFVV
ncbi:MAG: response regulator, partial [Deltaproteobacteria bacterium]|nr:response regulator [Deltaproteobacteria bacterium]